MCWSAGSFEYGSDCALPALESLQCCSQLSQDKTTHTGRSTTSRLEMPRPGCCSLCCTSSRLLFSDCPCLHMWQSSSWPQQALCLLPGPVCLCSPGGAGWAGFWLSIVLWTPPPLLLSNNTNLSNQVPCCVFPFCASCQLPARNIASLHSNVSINISVISWCSRSLYLVLICTTACICAVQKDASRIHFLSHITWKVFLKE